jgi:hypothetical protein
VVSSRRGWGEGAVYRRQQDGLWVGTIELERDHRGRRRRQAIFGRTEREALDKLDMARRDKSQGLAPTDQRVTTGEWLGAWPNSQRSNLTEEGSRSARVSMRSSALGSRSAACRGADECASW